jgi:hypothetical protein
LAEPRNGAGERPARDGYAHSALNDERMRHV